MIAYLLFIFASGAFISVSTEWPSGTYGIPRAKSGCPSSNGFTWHTGWRYQDTEDWFPSNKRSSSFHLDAWVSKNLNRTFCMKTTKTGDSSRPSWPKGKYCIYKKGSCPSGLQPGHITWDDENVFNKNNKGGVLPDGVYDRNTKIYYCCRTDGNKTEPIELPTDKPFFLVAYESAACQQVKWAEANSEWIRFDTEGNGDGYGGAYPYGAGMNDHTIHYCYYTSCNYTLTASSGLLQSPNYPRAYPAGQYCSWKINAPQGLQVLLKFSKFTVQKGADTDNVQVYDGQNETSPSLGIYSGDRAPPRSGVWSSSNELFIIFKTDSKSNFAGFQASYSVQRLTNSSTPTHAPTTPKTNSTRTTAQTNTTMTPVASGRNTRHFTTRKTTAKSGSESVPSKPETTNELPNVPSTAGSLNTQPSYEPTDPRQTFEPLKNESSFGYHGMKSGKVALIVVPTLLFVIVGVCLLAFFLYRWRNHKRTEKQEYKQSVYYESNPKTEPLVNPLYNSIVKISGASMENPSHDEAGKDSDVSMENPLYDAGGECALNPLYGSKLETEECDPTIPLESREPSECQNPIYESATCPSESSA